ncbi:MAG: hypothetical protein NTV84_12125 [Methanoregula sp.]|nr:hypothetical protein [Methanoregula sp.]
MANVYEPVGKKFSKLFCEKKISQIFSQQKKSTEIPEPQKKFRKIRASPIFKKSAYRETAEKNLMTHTGSGKS